MTAIGGAKPKYLYVPIYVVIYSIIYTVLRDNLYHRDADRTRIQSRIYYIILFLLYCVSMDGCVCVCLCTVHGRERLAYDVCLKKKNSSIIPSRAHYAIIISCVLYLHRYAFLLLKK